MKTLVSIPDSVIDKIEEFRRKYYPHLSLGKFLVNSAIEKVNEVEMKK